MRKITTKKEKVEKVEGKAAKTKVAKTTTPKTTVSKTTKTTKPKKTVKKETKKEVGKELLCEKKVEQKQEAVISPYKERFLEVIEEMLSYEKSIGNLIFNGIFRLPINKRLYECNDEEVLKAFTQQLNIMKKKRERTISEESKLKKLKEVAM